TLGARTTVSYSDLARAWVRRAVGCSHSLDAHHTLNLGKRTHHPSKLTDIAGEKREYVLRASVITRTTVGLAQVDLLRAEGLAYLSQNTRGVLCRNNQRDRSIDLAFRT